MVGPTQPCDYLDGTASAVEYIPWPQKEGGLQTYTAVLVKVAAMSLQYDRLSIKLD